MLNFNFLARASLMLIFFIAVQSAFAQCINGPAPVCATSQHTYNIDPSDLPNGTATTQWSVLGGTLTPPQTNTATNVTWGNGASGHLTARFLDASGQQIGLCTLSVAIGFLPQVALTPAVSHSCVISGEEGVKFITTNGYCQNELVEFMATGGLSYVWETTGGATVESVNNFAGTAMIRFSGTGPAEVCVTATGANGCQRKVCRSYVVYPLPTAGISVLSHPNANGSVNICLNESLTFEGLFSDPTPFDLGSYTWKVTASNDPTTILGGGAGQFFSFTFTQSGEYDVTVTATNCLGCADDAVMHVTVNPNAAPVITCPSVVCQDGDPVPYCAPTDCTNLTWSVTGGTSSQGNTWNCINVVWDNPPANGFGLVTLTCPDALCPLPTTVEVPIIPSDLDINGPTLICDNEQDNNVYSVPNWPGCTYDWSLDPMGATLVGTASGSSFDVDLEGFAGSQYTVTVTVRNIIANCTVTASLVVQVVDYNITVSPQGNFCYNFSNGSSPTFTVTPAPAPNYQIIWNISNNAHFWTTTTAPNINTLGGLDFNAAFGGSGVFNVYAIILDNNGESTCPGLASEVTISPEVVPITAVTGRTNICPGATYPYTVVPPGNQYEWTVTGGTITSPANPANASTVQIKWGQTAPYGLSVRRRIGTCFSDPFTLNITVATPPVNFSISSPGFAGCFDVPYTYVASDLNMDTYNWSVDGGMVLSGQGTHTVQIIWSPNASPYQITLNSKRCGINYQATLNPIFDLPILLMEGPVKVCQNTLVQYSVSPANGSVYTWYLDGDIIPNQTGPVLEIAFPFVGAATIRVRIEKPNGCDGFQNLLTPITVIANPTPYITQQGLLYCNEKGTTTLITQIASGGGTVFEWFHFENGGFVEVGQSAFSGFYTPNGPNLEIQFLPGGGILGLFQVVVSGGECVSEATRFVSCLPVSPNPGGEVYVHFTNWEYDGTCGEVTGSGQLFCEGLLNSWFQVLDPSLPNPFYADPLEICNPTVTIGTFTHPGVYQVALIGEFDFDGHGPNPPVRYADIREITIPYVLDFRPRVTCLDGQNGTYQVDLLNLTQQIPQFPNIEWTWSIDGGVWSNDLNPPPYTLSANQTIEVCLQGYVQVPDDENPSQLKDYRCEICQQISAPTNLTVGIGNVQSSTCYGLLVQPTAIVADPNLVLSYLWAFENTGFGVHYESNLPAPVFVPPFGGTYTLTLTVLFSNGCTATATQNVEVVFSFITAPIIEQPAACGEKILEVALDPPNTPVTYLWSSGQNTQAITATETGTYTVTVTETSNGCTLTNSASVLINGPFPTGYKGRFIQCEGESIMWVQVGVIAGHTYTFTLGTLPPLTFTPTGNQIAWNVPLSPATLPAGTYPFIITAVETATGLPCETQLNGTLQVNPVPAPVSVSVTYSCAPFSALLVANQNVSWYNSGVFVATGQQIRVYAGGTYEAVATNAYGCTKAAEVTVDGPPNVDILTGCYCIEPELVQSGQAVIQPPSGTYSSWAWVLNGSTILASCAPPASCGNIPPLVLQTGWEGDITLQVTQTYTNSDGSTVICSATSGVFCWWLGPCDSVPTCRIPEATTRTIACIEDYGTYQQYHIHWDFVDNGTTHPCDFPQNLGITGAYSGNFVMIDHSLINGYWHFEGIFNLNTNGAMPIPEPFDICWQIPFCLNSTGQQCGIANVCPKKDNPQHNDDVIINCYDHELPYCDDIQFDAVITCDDDPTNGTTHIVNLSLSTTIDATINTINCPNFSFYITSVTGTLPGGLIRIDVPNVPVINGQQTITANVPINWYDQIGIDYVCFQVILAHNDHCWPNDGNICSKRFCFDASQINCDLDHSPYRFTANCSREQGDGGVLYDYTVEFLNETNIQTCEAQNKNPNGFNKVLSIVGNKVSGTYLSYTGDLNFEDVFTVNGSTTYSVKATLPNCGDRDGNGKGGDRTRGSQDISKADATLWLMPNPNSGQVLLSYNLSENSVAAEHELVIVNALGMVQQRFDLGQFGTSSAISYDASGLPNGVYQVALLHQAKAVSVQRMVVLKDK